MDSHSPNQNSNSQSGWNPEPDFGKNVGIYWLGPYGVLVPERTFNVVAPNSNIISKDRTSILNSKVTLDKQTYMSRYAEYRDEKYYYIGFGRSKAIKKNKRDKKYDKETESDKKKSCSIL